MAAMLEKNGLPVEILDNTVAADALGAALMGFKPDKIEHIAITTKAGLGSSNLTDVKWNIGWQPFQRKFEARKIFLDRLSSVPFNSDFLATLIFQSPLTPLIYKIVG